MTVCIVFNKNNIKNKAKFGFRKKQSTTMTLSEFLERVLNRFDKGEAVCDVLLDLSIAFDSFERRVLLNK